MKDIHGVDYGTAIGLIIAITHQARQYENWTIIKNIAYFSGTIGGIPLTVRYDYKTKKNISISSRNYNWLLSFKLAGRMPAEEGIGCDIWLPEVKTQKSIKYFKFFNDPCVLSPEGFQKEMTILMLFSAEWENNIR